MESGWAGGRGNEGREGVGRGEEAGEEAEAPSQLFTRQHEKRRGERAFGHTSAGEKLLLSLARTLARPAGPRPD